MRQHKFTFTMIMLMVALSTKVFAIELGQHGRLYPIDEIDMRILIARDLQQVDIEAAHNALVKSANNYTSSLPSYSLPPTNHTLTRWIDPTVVLAQDIQAPVQNAQGDWAWQIIYKTGTKINPLEKSRPVTRMLFLDGRSDEQVAFAIAAAKANPYKLKLVLTDGDPSVLSKRIMSPVYYSNPTLINTFKLRFTPSLVGVGEGDHRLFLAVTEFAFPYRAELVDKAWYGLNEAQIK